MKVRNYIFMVAACAATIEAHSHQSISLDGAWTFHLPEDSACNICGAEPGEANASGQEIIVPHTYNLIPGLEDYSGEGFYHRTLPKMPLEMGERIWVRFNGVHHDARVHVNGKKAGEHLNSGYTPFTLEITDLLTEEDNNTLTVECDNSFTDTTLPWCRKFDWNNDGGIYRSVSLHKTGPLALRYAHVTPIIDLSDSTAQAAFRLRLRDKSPASLACRIKIYGSDKNTIAEKELVLNRQSDDTYNCVLDWRDLFLALQICLYQIVGFEQISFETIW